MKMLKTGDKCPCCGQPIAMDLERYGDVRVVSVKESGAPEYRQEVLRG